MDAPRAVGRTLDTGTIGTISTTGADPGGAVRRSFTRARVISGRRGWPAPESFDRCGGAVRGGSGVVRVAIGPVGGSERVAHDLQHGRIVQRAFVVQYLDQSAQDPGDVPAPRRGVCLGITPGGGGFVAREFGGLPDREFRWVG